MKAKKAFALFLTLTMSSTILPVTASAEEAEIPIQESENTSLSSEDAQKTPSPLEDTQTQEETSQAPENTQDVSTPSEAEDSKPPQNTQDNTEQSKTLNNTKPKTILFDNNGGEGTTPESITLANGDVFVFFEKVDITKQGFVFMGWDIVPDSTEPLFEREKEIVAEKLPATEEQNITLYAVWKEVQDCQILYDLCRGGNGNGEHGMILRRCHTFQGTHIGELRVVDNDTNGLASIHGRASANGDHIVSS